LALATVPIVLSAQPRMLKLVSTAWPPFTNGEGQPRFALDLVENALGRLHLSSMTTIVSPSDYEAKLLSGDFDGSAAAWRDPIREHVLLFSRPYLENRLVLVGRHGADVSATTLSALKGRRIGIVEGYSYGAVIEGSGPVWVRTSHEEDSLSELLQGHVDYALIDELVVTYLIANHPQEAAARLQIGAAPVLTRELYFAVSRTRHDAESIVNGFNTQIRNMIKDRTYHKLLHVAWISADINGDGVPELIPASDHPGPAAPTHSYSLFSLPAGTTLDGTKESVFVGGKVYDSWSAVPDSYKKWDPTQPDPRQVSPIFKFVW
jgi:polar amino acid transport system substrate-binding protein